MITSEKQIVIVSSEFPPQPGGIGNHAYQLARSLCEKEFEVTVIADQRSEDGQAEFEFDNGLNFKIIRVKKYNMRLRMYLIRILETFKSFKNASVVFATGKFSLWNVAFCNVFFKRQTIAVVHGSEVNFKSLLLKSSVNLALKRFDTIVAVSNFTKKLLDHLQKEIVVIPNGINVAEWEGAVQKKELKGDPVITTVGRVSERKGQLTVIKHLPLLIKHFPNIHYHCVGIFTEASEYMKIINGLNVSSHVTFHGMVDFNSLKSMLLGTNIFVMLSNESDTGDVEGFGIAILEANAMGIPAIGSNNCGIEDAIDNGITGRLIDSSNGSEFVESIELILNKRPIFSDDAEKWALKHDWNQIVHNYITLLN